MDNVGYPKRPGAEDLAAALPAQHEHKASPLRWAGLAVLLVGSFLPALDFFIVNIALPSIRQGLGAGDDVLQLVISGYAAAFAVLLVMGGRLGDLFGRNRMFVIGMTGFALCSALCGLAWSPYALVAGRILQGATAAIMAPQVAASRRQQFRRASSADVYSRRLRHRCWPGHCPSYPGARRDSRRSRRLCRCRFWGGEFHFADQRFIGGSYHWQRVFCHYRAARRGPCYGCTGIHDGVAMLSPSALVRCFSGLGARFRTRSAWLGLGCSLANGSRSAPHRKQVSVSRKRASKWGRMPLPRRSCPRRDR